MTTNPRPQAIAKKSRIKNNVIVLTPSEYLKVLYEGLLAPEIDYFIVSGAANRFWTEYNPAEPINISSAWISVEQQTKEAAIEELLSVGLVDDRAEAIELLASGYQQSPLKNSFSSAEYYEAINRLIVKGHAVSIPKAEGILEALYIKEKQVGVTFDESAYDSGVSPFFDKSKNGQYTSGLHREKSE